MKIGIALALALLGVVPAELGAQTTIPLPNRVNSSIPTGIVVVGRDPTNGHAPDPAGHFVVEVHDINDFPIPYIAVDLDLSPCSIRICMEQVRGVAVHCSRQGLSAMTDSRGRAAFSLLGSSETPLNPDDDLDGCATVSSRGVWLGNVKVATYDLDGSGELGSADLGVWLATFFSIPNPNNPVYSYESLDYNYDGILSPSDFSFLVGAHLRGGSASPACAGLCP